MRIGTWNLDARWTSRHRDFLERLECDVLLLTEVPPEVDLRGMVGHHSSHKMAPGQSWAAVYAPDLWRLPDPHPAAALAEVEGLRVCSSVLPWQGSRPYYPWGGDDSHGRISYAVDSIIEVEPLIWGGDWNASFAPRGYTGARGSREVLRKAADRLQLRIATEHLDIQAGNDKSIDHVAVPAHWTVCAAGQHRAEDQHGLLSDHDAYVVQVSPA
ncbi:hypothetical protein [Nocardioides bizhenqiangii]|uniref:Endonuclease/exonuclease/phosphatase domain-containing protein n=1 Tax=Nocardioides bizhenqiangii TaxID=3095076 RepID=A0ABZ0ZTV0_9ACTN|nr:hypothetical protein [Nocardioides sp. HM61]WQQ27289.1 hypothetical protein SHK19_03460 [Nocardioides sp. HM61]